MSMASVDGSGGAKRFTSLSSRARSISCDSTTRTGSGAVPTCTRPSVSAARTSLERDDIAADDRQHAIDHFVRRRGLWRPVNTTHISTAQTQTRQPWTATNTRSSRWRYVPRVARSAFICRMHQKASRT